MKHRNWDFTAIQKKRLLHNFDREVAFNIHVVIIATSNAPFVYYSNETIFNNPNVFGAMECLLDYKNCRDTNICENRMTNFGDQLGY